MSTARLLIIAQAAALLACGGNGGSPAKDQGGGTGDRGVARDSGVGAGDRGTGADKGSATCGPGVYPCGPYGKKVGDTIENYSLEGYADANYHCTDYPAMKVDFTKVQQIAMKGWHLGDSTCPDKKRKLLYIFTTAGW